VLRGAVPAALLALFAVVAGLTLPDRPPPAYDHYVALGDSFTAAPFVPRTDADSACLRSTNNYPRQVSNALRVPLDDRSCTGAQIEDLLDYQATRSGRLVTPQLTVLTPETDLVTVGIGFNQGRLYARIATRCRLLTTVCPLADERELLEGLVEGVRPSLTTALLEVRERAPQARVLVVGYPQLLPASGDCARLPRMRPEDRETFRALNLGLVRAQEAAADDVGAEYVDFYAHSEGHDICSDEPWVQGRLGDGQRAAALHPLPAGQQALAELVLETLQQAP
jgi:lysophospholipase L1-like esterase